jgi:hypothetical protein
MHKYCARKHPHTPVPSRHTATLLTSVNKLSARDRFVLRPSERIRYWNNFVTQAPHWLVHCFLLSSERSQVSNIPALETAHKVPTLPVQSTSRVDSPPLYRLCRPHAHSIFLTMPAIMTFRPLVLLMLVATPLSTALETRSSWGVGCRLPELHGRTVRPSRNLCIHARYLLKTKWCRNRFSIQYSSRLSNPLFSRYCSHHSSRSPRPSSACVVSNRKL